MPFDAGGTFTRSYNWQADRDAGIKILAQRMDGEFNNYAGGLNQTFLRTGIVPMGGPMNMNGNPIVGVAGGTLANPGFRFENDIDSGIASTGPGNVTIVADGVAAIAATSTGVSVNGAFGTNGTITSPGFYIDPNFWLALQGGSPIINFDANDFIRFNRTPNSFEHIISGAAQLNVSIGGITVGNSGSGIVYLGSGSAYIQSDPSASTWLMEPNYYFQHNKSTKTLSLVMGGAIAYDVRPDSINMSLPLWVTNNISAGGVIRTQGAGIGDILMQGGNGSVSGFISFLQVDDALHGWIGQQAPSGVINYWTSGGGHNFIGPITAGDYTGTGVVRAATFYADPSFYMTMSGPNSLINWDPGDYSFFERATNQFNWVANGVNVLNLTTGSASAHGIELGYKDIIWRHVTTPGGNVATGDRGKGVLFLPGASNHGITPCPVGTIVTLINASGIDQTIVNAGVNIYWAANNTAGNIIMAAGAVMTVMFHSDTVNCLVSGTGIHR